jgi:YidC/Oxa1 family membrane protein insertase
MENKTSIIGFVLIGILLVLWMWLVSPPPQAPRPAHPDSVRVAAPAPDTVRRKPAAVEADTSKGSRWGAYFAPAATGSEGIITVTTDQYVARISTRGGVIRTWELRLFKTWDKQPVELVDFEHGGDLSVLFTSADGRLINTHDLYFQPSVSGGTSVQLSGRETFSLDLSLQAGNGSRLVKRLTFTNGTYAIDADFIWQNMDRVVSNFEYQVAWESGLRYAEHNSVDESSFAMAYASMGGEVKEIDATKSSETPKFEGNGTTNWVAARTKYFLLALLPEEGKAQGAYLEGHRQDMADHGEKESYTVALKMPLKGGAMVTDRVTLFLGPLDYETVKGFGRGLDNVMSLGAAWIIRPIAEYVMIPIFQFLRMIIPNYGVVIIVFAIIIMGATYPLTRSSMRSMRKMQALQPLMEEVKEKYKGDPQKANAAVFNLYKEYGVSPAGGCLPVILQMPVLFALYAVLRSNIGLRQADFAFWIHDLSIPDTVIHLPFTIPFFGITALSGLALAMGLATFFQQKQTLTDPRQKSMVYVMPVMLTLVFNSLPAGLNLYYFVFNILSIGQRLWMNHKSKDEPLRKVDPKKRKGGIMERLARDLPKVK